MSNDITSALRELEASGDRPERFGTSFLAVFPVTGAAVSTVGRVLGSETITATDAVAARLDEIQFDVAEGPCWDAVRTAAAVVEPDLAGRGLLRWPAFVAAVDHAAVASIFAFPLAVGGLRFGAVDLYSQDPLILTPEQQVDAAAMAGVIGRHVLRDALNSDSTERDADGPYSRRRVHQATGVILAQLDISPDDALLVLQAHAFATDQRVMEVAEAVLGGALRFTRTATGIEAQT